MVTENDYLIKKAFYQVGFDLCKEKKRDRDAVFFKSLHLVSMN